MPKWIRRMAQAVRRRLHCYLATAAARHSSSLVLGSSPLRRVLVVCYGNIYRSAYATAMLKQRLSGPGEIRSAGFYPVSGRPSPEPLVEASRHSGVDLTAHRSSVITAADIDWADSIVLMDRHNWQALRELGAAPGKLIWLGTLDGGRELPDPFGMPEPQVQRIMRRLHNCTEALAGAIVARRNSPAG